MADDDFESNKKELRRFLLDTDALERLENYADRQNIFRILSIENMEIKHSNFLAWLLDPTGNHKLGDTFLKKFLLRYAEDSRTDIDVFDIDKMDLDDAIVYRELYHMDIIVQSKKSDFVLAIENKIRSSERPNQTSNYRAFIEEHYKNVKNKYLVFLTLDHSDPEDSHWIPMSYSQIIPLIEPMADRMPSDSPGRLLVSNYTELLKEMAGDEETELQALCRDIYARHQKAIDILIKNIPDDFQRKADIIKKIVRETPGITYRRSNNSYIRFTTEPLLEKFGLIGTGEWTDEKDVILFEIVNNRDGAYRFVLSIGTAEDPDKRKKMIGYFTGKWNKKTTYTDKWSRVYSKTFRLNDDEDFEEQFRKKVNEFVTKTIPKDINPIIEAFPGFE